MMRPHHGMLSVMRFARSVLSLRSGRLCGLVAVLAILLLQPVSTARAECDVEDAFAAVTQAVETTFVCQPVCAKSKYNCYGAAGLAIVLTEISRRDGQGQARVDSFCSSVESMLVGAKDDVQVVKDIMDLLQQLGLTSAQSNTASSALAAVGEAIDIVKCACKTEQLQLKNEYSFGACINDVLQEVGCGKIDFATATFGDCDPVGGFVGGLVNDALNELVGLGCTLEIWSCGEHVPERDYEICDKGLQSDGYGSCIPCESIAHAKTLPNGECGCNSLYTANSLSIFIGQYTTTFSILESCTCKAPLVQDAGGRCLCAFGKVFSDGQCTACPPDRKYVPYRVDEKGNEYLPNCAQQCPLGWSQSKSDPTVCVTNMAMCETAKGEVRNPDTFGRTCMTCKPKQRVATGVPVYGAYCEDCPANTKPSADRTSCVPGCDPGQVLGGLLFGKDQAADPNAAVCQTCPANSYAAYEDETSSKGTCLLCPDGTFSNAGATSCLPLNCGPGAFQDPDDAHACKSCPPTQIYIPAQKKIVKGAGGESKAVFTPGHCGCGENQVLKGGKCMCADGAFKVDIPQAGNALFACGCPEGSQFNAKKGACMCPPGAKFSSSTGADRTCVCTGGATLEGGKCVPAAKRVVPSAKCPAGEIRNDKGVCEKRGETPKARTRPKPSEATPSDLAPVSPPKLKPAPETLSCPPGWMPGPLGKRCIRIVPKDFSTPKLHVPAPLICPRGMTPDATGQRCVPAR